MRVLVAGAERVDAGKTTFSVGLVERLGATGFKPRAGNDYWFDHADVRHAVSEGRLYGKDARRLAAASAGDPDPETINPIHRLWRPSTGRGKGLVGPADREFVLDRVDASYVANTGATVPGPVSEGLPVEDAVGVDSVDALNDATQRRHLPALRAIATRIRRTDPAVVESYGDVARPLQGSTDDATDLYDAVAVVEPFRARVFRAGRFVRACSVARASPAEGSLERRVPDVCKHLDPVATVRLPPLSDDRRKDPGSVVDAYGEAYDAVLREVGK